MSKYLVLLGKLRFFYTVYTAADLLVLRQFLAHYIGSYEELDAVLCLFHSTGGQSAAAIASHLNLGLREVVRVLQRLVAAQLALARADNLGVYQFNFGSDELAKKVALLSEVNDQDRVKLVELMSAASVERVRSSARRAFESGPSLTDKKNRGTP